MFSIKERDLFNRLVMSLESIAKSLETFKTCDCCGCNPCNCGPDCNCKKTCVEEHVVEGSGEVKSA